MDIDRKECTVIADRGSALKAAMKKHFKHSFLRPCNKHIEGNVISEVHISKSDDLIGLYWKAVEAKTFGDFCTVVEIIETKHKGN